MRKYEFLLLIKPNLNSDDEAKFIENFEKRINGNIIGKDDWGLKTLAYQIKKEKEAHYILYYIEADPTNVIATREWMNIQKLLLRSMVIVHEKKWPFDVKTSKSIKFPERKSYKNNAK